MTVVAEVVKASKLRSFDLLILTCWFILHYSHSWYADDLFVVSKGHHPLSSRPNMQPYLHCPGRPQTPWR